MSNSDGATTDTHVTRFTRASMTRPSAPLLYDLGVRSPRSELDLAAHRGTASDFLNRHRQEAEAATRGDANTRHEFVKGLFERVADTRNLHAAYVHIRSHGGDAPGVDQLRPADIDFESVWGMVRVIRASLLDDTYRPARMRKKKILKSSGIGFRKLSIPTLVDRIVQRALVQVVEPYLDPHFDDDSFGFRRQRGRLQALARAQWYTIAQDRWVWIAEDLKDAFNHVPQCRLLDIIRLRLSDNRLMKLIELLVMTPMGRGVPQGGPAAPVWLNVYLDHFLDNVWRQRKLTAPLVRVADDLLLLCHDVTEAQSVYRDLAELLRPTGMILKGTAQNTTRDLAVGQIAEWLGYRIVCVDGQLRYDTSDRAWKSLAQKLALAHDKPSSPLAALDTLAGWVSQIGPAYADGKVAATYDRVCRIALEQGFEELPSAKDFRVTWLRAHDAWLSTWNKEWDGRSVPILPNPIPKGDNP